MFSANVPTQFKQTTAVVLVVGITVAKNYSKNYNFIIDCALYTVIHGANKKILHSQSSKMWVLREKLFDGCEEVLLIEFDGSFY